MVKKRRYKDSSEEEEKYHVEVITKARVTKDREWEYYVKWAGYGPEADTWEPSDNVKECERLLRSFWRHIGEDDEDYDVGATFEAKPDWIASEKKYFHDNFGKEDPKPEKRRKKKPREDPKKVTGKAQKKSKNVKKPTYVYTESSSSESEADIPMSKRMPTPPRAKLTTKRIQSPESSDSDTPLRKAPRKESLASASSKDKGKAPVRPRPETPPPQTPHSELHSLFSAPPTPEVTSLFSAPPTPDVSTRTKSLPDPAQRASTSTTMPPPRVPAQTHKERQQNPRIKMLDLPTSVGQAIATKQKIAARTNSLQTPNTTSTSLPIPYDQRKNPLKTLHFKKKKPTVDTSVANANKAVESPTQASGSGQAAPLFLPEASQVNSPVSAGSGTWGRTSQSPAPAADNGGWGPVNNTQASTSGSGGGWGDPPITSSASGWGDTNDSDWRPGSWGVLEPDSAPAASPSNLLSKPSPPVRGQSLENTTVQSRRSSGSVPIPRTNASPRSPSAALQAAENFLAGIMLGGPTAPMDDTLMNIDQPVTKPAAPPAVKKTPLTQYQVVDKWQWAGELWVETDPQKSERLCNVRLSESTQPRPNGLRMSVCYTPTDPKLRLAKFYNTADIHTLLDMCAPIQQFCKVSHQDEADESVFNKLSQYMARKHLFTLSHSYLDEDPVGILIIFSSTNAELCAILKTPPHLREGETLLAAFIPCNLTYKQYTDYRWQQPLPSSPYEFGALDPQLEEKLKSTTRRLAKNPELTRWLRLHRFTLPIYDFLTRAERHYCLWTTESQRWSKTQMWPDNPDTETQSLIAVLKSCNATNVGHRKDVRVIFVHVAALPTFHKFNVLALRRMKQPDMRIYLYGSDSSVPSARWGLREIYPIGGVISFTPKVILEDPFEVYKLIELVREHPLWTCYVHPFTVAAVARLSYPDADTVSLIEKNDFFFLRLLELIEQGHLSLLYAPPLNKPPKLEADRVDQFSDPVMDWTCWCTDILSMGPKELMEECRTMLLARHGKKSDGQLAAAVDKDILVDMIQMQQQPSLMDTYRRFVMIIETRNEHVLDVDGVELATLPKFDFRDDYFTHRRSL